MLKVSQRTPPIEPVQPLYISQAGEMSVNCIRRIPVLCPQNILIQPTTCAAQASIDRASPCVNTVALT